MNGPGKSQGTHGKTQDLLASPSPSAARSAKRFKIFQNYVLTEAVENQPVQRLLVGSLIAFDAVLSRADLIRSLQKYDEWVYEGGQLAVSWSNGRLTHRRVLSGFTAVCWNALSENYYAWNAEILALAKAFKIYSKTNGTVEQVLEEILLCGRHWTSLVLPPLLSQHLEGVLPLAAVSDQTWRRRYKSVSADILKTGLDNISDDFADALFQASVQTSSKGGEWFLASLKGVFRGCTGDGINLSNARARDQLMENLKHLYPEAIQAGSAGLLLFGWINDMLLHGSVRVAKPAIQTLKNYVGVAAKPLLQGMMACGIDPTNIEEPDWRAIYEAALAISSEGSVQILSPALASFHRFLVRALDVDPLESALLREFETAPMANVVWPHEFDLAYQLLKNCPLEERLQSQCVVLFSLLRRTNLRRSEIAGLRLGSLRFQDNCVLIDVSPKRGHKSLKSAAARRTVEVTEQDARDILRAWLERRRAEAAVNDDLLFADPHRPQLLYKMGQSYRLVMSALKTATGDPNVTWHTCRHTYASERTSAVLMSKTSSSVSPLHVLQHGMGHANLSTTVQTYFHLYEDPIRSHLNAEILGQVTSRVLEIWTGTRAATLRQCKRRNGSANDEFVLEALKNSHNLPQNVSSEILIPDQSSRTALTIDAAQMTVLQMAQILSDIQRRINPRGICSANCIAPDVLYRVCELIVDRELASKTDEQTAQLISDAASELNKLDFSRMDWPLWSGLLKRLDQKDLIQRKKLASAWSDHGRPEGLALAFPEDVVPLIELLAEAKFPAQKLRLRIAKPMNGTLSDACFIKLQQRIRLAVGDPLNEEVAIEYVAQRSGRATAYLVPLTQGFSGTKAPPAVVDAKSLYASMYAFVISERLKIHDD
jgi:integrase